MTIAGGKTGDATLEETEETVKNKDGSVAKDKSGNEIKKKGWDRRWPDLKI